MKYSQIKSIKSFCNSLLSDPDWREVVENIINDEHDFEVNNVRFITDNMINEVLADELQNDMYLLGCFVPSFIAEQCNWPVALVEAAQQGEAFEALGQAIADNCDMEEFAEAYVSADGYGHHFNSYDGGEEEITIKGVLYHVFDNY